MLKNNDKICIIIDEGSQNGMSYMGIKTASKINKLLLDGYCRQAKMHKDWFMFKYYKKRLDDLKQKGDL